MEDQPERALEMLRSVERSELTTRKAQARYSLLLSMALDKNYVDVADDSVIAPAVAYYKNHGRSDERLKTYYYWGRVAMNAGDYEDAASRFTIAERYAGKASDKLAVGRLYKAQTSVYQYCYDTDAMIEASGKAAGLYMSICDTGKYVASLFDMTAAYLNEVDTMNARKTLDHVKEYWARMNEWQRSQYFANQLILAGHASPSHLLGILNEYEEEVSDPRSVQWLPVAKAYYVCGDYEKALDAIERINEYGGDQNDAYFWISGLVYEALGDQSHAMGCYRNYIDRTDGKLGYLLETDVRFVKERYEDQIKIAHRNYALVILVLCAMVLSLSTALVLSRIKRMKKDRRLAEEKLRAENDRYVAMYNAAIAEIANLNDTLRDNTLDKTAKVLVGERLSLLNKFIASNMTPNFSIDAAEELNQLMRDKNYFIESTRISFLIEHPEFVGYLKDKGLTDGEVGYCCFYAMGLKGKDISSYMGNGHYKLSSAIRKKLGLSEHDTNLDIFLRKKLAETSR